MPLFPVQNHLLAMYCKVHAWPIAEKVIVPVPELFHPALATVITMSPPSPTMAKVLICPSVPATKVAVSAPAVVKYDTAVVELAVVLGSKSSLDCTTNGAVNLARGLVNSLR